MNWMTEMCMMITSSDSRNDRNLGARDITEVRLQCAVDLLCLSG
jgi:hypothetical protein